VGVLSCFSVSLQPQAERDIAADISEVARLVGAGCSERNIRFAEAAMALDCGMFMQHDVHSEFKDAKQISQTVRFDAEEVLSTDVSDLALAFRIVSTNESGAQLDVFAAQRMVLSAALATLQNNSIDPVTVEPDINCLSRFIQHNMPVPEGSNPLFAVLARRSGYFVGPSQERTAFVRTFLIDRTPDRGALLARQIPITTALIGGAQAINCLRISDSVETTNVEQLAQQLGLEAAHADLVESCGADRGLLADGTDAVDFAIAYGAALAGTAKAAVVDFREDFMPYQGKKRRRQKALKFLSISVTVLMIALGMYVTPQLLQMTRYRSRLWDKFKPQYSAVMLGRKPSKGFGSAVRTLERAQRKIAATKGGGGPDEQTVAAKLLRVLLAFNECAKSTKLNVDSISITGSSIVIAGNTTKRSNTLKVRRAIANKNLGTLTVQVGGGPKGTKGDGFRFTITRKRQKGAVR
jgi:hypothetical protein